jgi:chromosomal replication initiator protein
MSRTHLEIWHNCLRTIQTEIDAQTYKTWFVPIKPLRLEEDVLTIQVPNRFFYDWL